MKEQNENRSKGVILGFRPALNPPHLGRDEFKLLGQASSELFAKLGNKSKVGDLGEVQTQPPSEITSRGKGGENVIYLNSKQHLRKEKAYKTTHEENYEVTEGADVIFWFK